MAYAVFILRRAQRELSSLPNLDYERVRDAIRELGDNPRPAGCLQLSGREGWRIRVGVYRVIYDVDDAIAAVTVLNVGHRRNAYR